MVVDGDRQHFQALLERLVSGVVATTPIGGDIVVTADDDDDGVEVEVAHSSTGFFEEAGFQAAADRNHESGEGQSDIEDLVNTSGGLVRASQWPEGGVTYTITIQRHLDEGSGSRKAA